jgi:hypothetical protein
MTAYLLDTDMLTHYERGHAAVIAHVQSQWLVIGAVTVIHLVVIVAVGLFFFVVCAAGGFR